MIARSVQSGDSSNADARRSDITDMQWLAAGLPVLADGSNALNEVLADVKCGHVNNAGRYRARYHFFFEWLRYRDGGRDFDITRDLVRDFA